MIRDHFHENKQMLFLSGARQVGKTTLSLAAAKAWSNHFYLNWDILKDRRLILQGPEALMTHLGLTLPTMGEPLPLLIFDELHKYSKWKLFLKGLYDKYGQIINVLVTGSARLDIYKKEGDSLMGRYFPYRIHPLSVAELLHFQPCPQEIRPTAKEIEDTLFQALLQFGGFPDPFLKQNTPFHTRWKNLRSSQLFKEDLRDLTRIQELHQIQVLAELLQEQAGQLLNYQSLANKVTVSVDTIKRWINVSSTLN